MATLSTELRPGRERTKDGYAIIPSFTRFNVPLPVHNFNARNVRLPVGSVPDFKAVLPTAHYQAKPAGQDLSGYKQLTTEIRSGMNRAAACGSESIISYLRGAPDLELPYMDNTPRFTESTEAPVKITEVDFGFGCTYDSAISFRMDTVDGIRAVLDDDDKVIESSSNTYQVDGLRLGKQTRRTIITNSDFRLKLSLKPTIVKADGQAQ